MTNFTPPAQLFTMTATDDVPVCPLPDGKSIPAIGYGTFRSAPGEVGPAVISALKAGYRHLDLAHVYGNEKEVGAALKQAFDEGIVTRQDLFITGKLWNSDHDVEIVPQACDYSLNDLGIDYFDMYLIHFPVCWKHTGLSTPSWGKSELGSTSLIDTWRAMEGLVDAGKCRSIGVSNYPLLLLHDLVCQARIIPACNQIEVHAFYTRESLVNYCLSRKIAVVAHTPLGGGLLNKETWAFEAPMESSTIQSIAKAHGVAPAQVLLRYLLQRSIVVIPKSTKPDRIAQNLDLLKFELTADEMDSIGKLDNGIKTNPNPFDGVVGGPDQFTPGGTDIFD